MSSLIHYAIPFFFATMLLEFAWTRWALRPSAPPARSIRGYALRDTLASLAMGVGNVLIAGVVKAAVVLVWYALYKHRIFDITPIWWSWIALFFAEDFCYYWFHRAHHEVRFFWAAHVNHHSSVHYNLSTALRQSWTTPATGLPFWLILPWIGFPPEMILLQQAISLLYQYWLHTESIGSMGPFEWLFNSPSAHRVHHGRNVRYLDRNHAGILIIWDKLFGTYEPESEAPDYGLTKNLDTYNPLRIAFHEWGAILRDVASARSVSDMFAYVFGPPGWSPDGSRETAKQMRARSGL